jgi:tetratricopeptide (TPR) repeat protein
LDAYLLKRQIQPHPIIFAFVLLEAFCYLTTYAQPLVATPTKSKLISAELCFQEGERLRQSGEFNNAAEAFERGLVISQKSNNHELRLKLLINLGLAQWNAGRLPESSENFSTALKLASEISDSSASDKCSQYLEIFNLYQAGKESRSNGQFGKSINSFSAAIEVARRIQSAEHELKCLRQLSTTYWEINDYNSFYLLNNQALKIALALKHTREEGYCYNNIGLYFWKIDSYSNSLANYEKALAVAKEINDTQTEADCLNNIGLIFRDMGNYDKALEYLARALHLDQTLGNNQKVSIDLNNIGATYRNQGLLSGKKEDYISAKENLG